MICAYAEELAPRDLRSPAQVPFLYLRHCRRVGRLTNDKLSDVRSWVTDDPRQKRMSTGRSFTWAEGSRSRSSGPVCGYGPCGSGGSDDVDAVEACSLLKAFVVGD